MSSPTVATQQTCRPNIVSSPTVATQQTCRANIVSLSTATTARITSTVAPLPGHTIPKTQAVVSHTSPYKTRSLTQQQITQVQHPVSGAPPVVTTLVHRQPALPNQRFPNPYQVPSQLRHPQPMPPGNATQQSTRPLPPTVTVHPQTQPPSSSSAAQRSFHRAPPPSAFRQSGVQTVYSNSHPAQSPQIQPRPSVPAQVPRVQTHATYMVRAPVPAQQLLPSHHNQEPNRMQPVGEAPPSTVPSLQPARPALLPTRMQSPLTAIRPAASVQLQSPPVQQAPVRAQAEATPPGYLQAESRAPAQVVQPVAPAAQPTGDGGGNEPPPKPTVSIAVVMSGIVLSWNMQMDERHAKIVSYQLFALQDGSTNTGAANQWKKIGVVKALPLPMACTLTQFLPGNKYHFAVRASDSFGRAGPFSEPCTITLK